MLPTRVFGTYADVSRLVLETTAGSYGILPNRMDFAAGLVPGILEYETEAGVAYIAIGHGIGIKTGSELMISVHNAYGNAPLGELKKKIREELAEEEDNTINIRSVLARMESSFVRNIQHLKSI